MIRFANISRTISNILVELKGLGGTTQNRMISPKGLYSRSKDDNALVIPLLEGNSQDIVFVLQKEVDIEDGDIYLTDDKSYIHFQYEDGHLKLKTNDFKIETKNLKLEGDNVSIKAKEKIELEGNDMSVEAKASVEIKANAKLALEGSSAELKGNGTAKVDGVVVKSHTHNYNAPLHPLSITPTSPPV